MNFCLTAAKACPSHFNYGDGMFMCISIFSAHAIERGDPTVLIAEHAAEFV
jgi:hypothetical protein